MTPAQSRRVGERECETQAEVNLAIAEGDLVVLRAGYFILNGTASATLFGTARAALYGSASATLYGTASATLFGTARAALYGSASATLYGTASATLYGSASATLFGTASAALYDTASATLYGSASATLFGTARATLYGSASATLFGTARATLHHSARAFEGVSRRPLHQSRPVILIGPIGSRDAMLSVYQCEDGGQLIRAGCFLGTRDEFAADVKVEHKKGRYADEYRAALAMIDALKGTL